MSQWHLYATALATIIITYTDAEDRREINIIYDNCLLSQATDVLYIIFCWCNYYHQVTLFELKVLRSEHTFSASGACHVSRLGGKGWWRRWVRGNLNDEFVTSSSSQKMVPCSIGAVFRRKSTVVDRVRNASRQLWSAETPSTVLYTRIPNPLPVNGHHLLFPTPLHRTVSIMVPLCFCIADNVIAVTILLLCAQKLIMLVKYISS